MKLEAKLEEPNDYLRKYPRICAHIICESLGYATPTKAANVLMNAHRREPDCCEWIYTCYETKALAAVEASVRRRHMHKGYMGDYRAAKAIVNRANNSGEEPLLASWF